MGRKKQPIDLLVERGNTHLTKEEIEERKATEIIAPLTKITSPKLDNKEAVSRFRGYAKALAQLNLFGDLDHDMLANYVVAEMTLERLNRKVLAHNMEDMDVFKKLSVEQDRYAKQAKMFAVELGLTISSRCRLVIPQDETPKEKTEEEIMFGDVI